MNRKNAHQVNDHKNDLEFFYQKHSQLEVGRVYRSQRRYSFLLTIIVLKPRHQYLSSISVTNICHQFLSPLSVKNYDRKLYSIKIEQFGLENFDEVTFT